MAPVFSKFGASLEDLRAAYEERLRDAEACFATERHAAAMVMATYAVEILLKCLICKLIREPKLPRAFYVHDLEELLILSGLRQRLEEPEHRAVRANWLSLVGKQDVDYRYLAGVSAKEATDFLRKLREPKAGIIPWLQQFL